MTNDKLKSKLAALSEGFEDDWAVNNVKETQSEGDPQYTKIDEFTLVTTNQGRKTKFPSLNPDENNHSGDTA